MRQQRLRGSKYAQPARQIGFGDVETQAASVEVAVQHGQRDAFMTIQMDGAGKVGAPDAGLGKDELGRHRTRHGNLGAEGNALAGQIRDFFDGAVGAHHQRTLVERLPPSDSPARISTGARSRART